MGHQKMNSGFTLAEKRILAGLSVKIAQKHGCSSMYVRYIINGQRNAKSVLAQAIVKDLKAILALLEAQP